MGQDLLCLATIVVDMNFVNIVDADGACL